MLDFSLVILTFESKQTLKKQKNEQLDSMKLIECIYLLEINYSLQWNSQDLFLISSRKEILSFLLLISLTSKVTNMIQDLKREYRVGAIEFYMQAQTVKSLNLSTSQNTHKWVTIDLFWASLIFDYTATLHICIKKENLKDQIAIKKFCIWVKKRLRWSKKFTQKIDESFIQQN